MIGILCETQPRGIESRPGADPKGNKKRVLCDVSATRGTRQA
jgi:hypothetical protein